MGHERIPTGARAVMPLNGWLIRVGTRSLYLGCFSAYTIASALCGVAWSAHSLIAFRILQGMLSGLVAPMAQLIMAKVAGRHMAKVLGYVAVPILLGPVLGPVIAGAILQHLTWRWLFLVNLPGGALGLLLAVLFLPRDEARPGQRPFDLQAFFRLSPALVLFPYGTDHIQPHTVACRRPNCRMATATLNIFSGSAAPP